MRLIFMLAVLALAGCAALPERTDPGARVIAIGDSVLAWNRADGASIVDRVEQRMGEPIVDASVPGAQMRQGGVRGAFGLSIPAQYRSGDWDAVIVNGGANDLLADCQCARCDAVLDRLVREDYPALLDRLGDARIYILGYYGPAGDRRGSFNACDDELQVLEQRLTRLAARRPTLTVVTVRDAITGNPRLYDADRVHPSPAGSAVIGDILASALVANRRTAR